MTLKFCALLNSLQLVIHLPHPLRDGVEKPNCDQILGAGFYFQEMTVEGKK